MEVCQGSAIKLTLNVSLEKMIKQGTDATVLNLSPIRCDI